MNEEEKTEALAELIHRELVQWRAEKAKSLHWNPEMVYLAIDTKVTALERQIAKAICEYQKDENR